MSPLVPSPVEAVVTVTAVIIGIALLVIVVRWAIRGIVHERRSRQKGSAAADERGNAR